jgi:hypothetical protein
VRSQGLRNFAGGADLAVEPFFQRALSPDSESIIRARAGDSDA